MPPENTADFFTVAVFEMLPGIGWYGILNQCGARVWRFEKYAVRLSGSGLV